jgi:hypothetical protein
MRRSRRYFLKSAGLTPAAALGLRHVFGQSQDAKKRGIALTIGLNRVSTDHYGSAMPLRGCVNDARDIFAIARGQQFECFEPLLDDKATRAEVITSIRQAANELQPGDLFLLHYSGHGASIRDQNQDEPDGRDETWCLYDGMMIDDELALLWGEFRPGVRIVVLSDSCHSGTVTRGRAFQDAVKRGDVGGGHGKRGVLEDGGAADAEGLTFRYISDDEADRTVDRNRDFYAKVLADAKAGNDEKEPVVGEGEEPAGPSVLLISGCQDNQLSGDLASNGVFTSAVKRIWDDGKFAGSWRTFHAAIVRIMPSTQTPNFYPTGVFDPALWALSPFTI